MALAGWSNGRSGRLRVYTLLVAISAIVLFSGGVLTGITCGKNSVGCGPCDQESLRPDAKPVVLGRFKFPSGEGAPLAAEVTISQRGSDILFEASLVPDRDVWVGNNVAVACNDLGNAAVITTFPDRAYADSWESCTVSSAFRPRMKGKSFKLRAALKGMQVDPVVWLDSSSRSISVFLHVTESIPDESDLHFHAQRLVIQFMIPSP